MPLRQITVPWSIRLGEIEMVEVSIASDAASAARIEFGGTNPNWFSTVVRQFST